ncbi:hypothetical protein [Vogesella alkaliphila]|uniref:hypothetical protein n=1 Tax=Vogesella alkaliphila TaxID=1193621 RepID=UPI001673006C|nr:hypothetical protein [Vogesella alkaliphila]
MTFIIAIQTEDSVILAADNIFVLKNKKNICHEEIMASKIHHWDNGIFTGTGDYFITDRMLNHLLNGNELSSLPSLLEKEKQRRRQQVGQHEQIDVTTLILSAQTMHGPRLHIVNSVSVDQVSPNELLMFFPFGYDFFSVSSKAVRNLNASLRSRYSFPNHQEWFDFYTSKFSEIYALQHQYNPQISKSYHASFQAKDFSETIFMQNGTFIGLKTLNIMH